MKVLGIDTATPFGVIGLLEDGNPSAEIRLKIRPGGGERLPAALADLLATLGWQPSQLDLIAVGIGPGSYTGIRAGIALARSLAFGISRPLVGISTHEALGAGGAGWRGVVAVLTDARRKEVYATYLRRLPQEEILRQPTVLGLDDAIAQLNLLGEPVLLLGDGGRVYRRELEEGLTVPAVWGQAESEIPSGFVLARLGLARWLAQGRDELDTCSPLYLRRVEAEIRLEERRKNAT